MKPAPFTYHRPTGVGEARSRLADAGDHGKVLAGGQSLVPMLSMRLATVGELIDINQLAELRPVTVTADAVRVGALARHREVERDPAVAAAVPLLPQALAHVAHPTIRNRGTVVGSLVHADPAAELPAVLLLLDGSVELASAGGATRVVPAGEFFLGPLESAVRPGELAVAARFPLPPAGSGSAWVEVSRRRGDYAVVGVAMLVTLDPEGHLTAAAASYISVAATPLRLELTEVLAGQRHDRLRWGEAGAFAAVRVAPEDDIHASAGYRRHLVAVLTERAGRLATAAAKGEGGS